MSHVYITNIFLKTSCINFRYRSVQKY